MSVAARATALWCGQPAADCDLCARLVAFRSGNRARYPHYFNGAVPSFGKPDARLLIVGLAPGLQGANRTGRPFTGDYAGDLLYATLKKHGLAHGEYDARADDGFTLVDCAITNAVRCVPPENKPSPAEIRTCRDFLASQIAQMANLKALLTLGRIAYDSVLASLSLPRKDYPFSHGAIHRTEKVTLIASYHCSRYNTNTGVLTTEMFERAVLAAKDDAGL